MSNIIYLAEHRNGSFRKPILELASYARAMADLTGGNVYALVLGEVASDELSVLGKYGTDHILYAGSGAFEVLDNSIWASAMAQAASKADAKLVLLASSLAGKAIAPAVAVKMNAGLAAGVTTLAEGIHPMIVKRKVYTGKAFASVSLSSEVKVLSISPNSFEIKEVAKDVNIENWHPENLPAPIAELIESSTSEGKILLAEAEIVVSAGRGMKGPENWKPVEDLAEVLGAATACSRPVSDEGWRPHAEHVGQTGKVIAPNLYFAFGISGAVQHVAGVSSSKVIVAVNKDPEAPIFSVADYGIIGDLQQVLPALLASAKKFKENT